jgi:hypothetical protein
MILHCCTLSASATEEVGLGFEEVGLGFGVAWPDTILPVVRS